MSSEAHLETSNSICERVFSHLVYTILKLNLLHYTSVRYCFVAVKKIINLKQMHYKQNLPSTLLVFLEQKMRFCTSVAFKFTCADGSLVSLSCGKAGVCSENDVGLTLTYFGPRSNLVT